jgi:coronin-1B/1C/6
MFNPSSFEGVEHGRLVPSGFFAVGDHTMKLWDLCAPESRPGRAMLTGHGYAIQSLTFSPTGQLLVTTSRDHKLRLFDPREGGEAVRVAEGHGGIKGAHVVWMGDRDRIATMGFSRMSDRQVGAWETRQESQDDHAGPVCGRRDALLE